jgi:hypothetical protein
MRGTLPAHIHERHEDSPVELVHPWVSGIIPFTCAQYAYVGAPSPQIAHAIGDSKVNILCATAGFALLCRCIRGH